MPISRRAFVGGLAGTIGALGIGAQTACRRGASLDGAGELLYNGIRLPAAWPPRYESALPEVPPYLRQRPAVVPIDIGRQLFVDDFLVETSSLTRAHHAPRYVDGNPVLRPVTPWERYDRKSVQVKYPPSEAAMPFSDGVFFDPADGLFKMWYMAGYQRATGYAVSEDGRSWTRPVLDVVPGTNIVFPHHRDSSTVWLDLGESNPAMRYKMLVDMSQGLRRFCSADGIHWQPAGFGGPSDERTTFFHNPFRRVWGYSIRTPAALTRSRRYWESSEFAGLARWDSDSAVRWAGADALDLPRADLKQPAELYALDCVAYESLMLGLFTIFRGEGTDREKPNMVCAGYSRDGFHWSRPSRSPFLDISEQYGDWNWGNVQSAGGCCLIVGDELHFYVSGRSGVRGTNLPGACSTGLAVLRRDGFVSLDADPASRTAQSVTTRPVTFSGAALFVNADLKGDELRVEVIGDDNKVIEPFSASNCVAVRGNATRMPVLWSHGRSLGDLAGRPVRFRFSMRSGSLYAFWVSRSASGASNGYVAAGGPGFSGPVDA